MVHSFCCGEGESQMCHRPICQKPYWLTNWLPWYLSVRVPVAFIWQNNDPKCKRSNAENVDIQNRSHKCFLSVKELMFPTEFFRCAGVARIYNRDSSESVKKEKEIGDRQHGDQMLVYRPGIWSPGNGKKWERKRSHERSEYSQQDFLRGWQLRDHYYWYCNRSRSLLVLTVNLTTFSNLQI